MGVSMILRRDFIQMLALMAFQSEPNNEAVKRLAELSGWTIAEERLQEIGAIYRGIYDDTRLLRATDFGKSVPASVFEAE